MLAAAGKEGVTQRKRGCQRPSSSLRKLKRLGVTSELFQVVSYGTFETFRWILGGFTKIFHVLSMF